MRWLFKRWWFWAGTGFVLLALMASYLLIPVDEGRISRANCKRIQLGWTLEEVKSLLGEYSIYGPEAIGLDTQFFVWREDENSIRVIFSAQGTVIKKEFRSTRSTYEYIKSRIERHVRAFWP